MKNTLLARMGFEDHELKTPLHDEICMWASENWQTIASEASNALVRSGKRRAFGSQLDLLEIEWERPVSTRSGSIVGFHDIWMFVAWPNGTYEKSGEACRSGDGFGVEVKTSIRSAGELIRQLKVTGTTVVVCPDDRFAELLRGQGFGFVKYPGPLHIAGDLFND